MSLSNSWSSESAPVHRRSTSPPGRDVASRGGSLEAPPLVVAAAEAATDAWRRLRRPLEEIRDDLLLALFGEGRETSKDPLPEFLSELAPLAKTQAIAGPGLLVLLLAGAAVPAGGPVSVVLCGLAASLKGLYFAAALGYSSAALLLTGRIPEATNRWPHYRSAAGLFASAASYVVLGDSGLAPFLSQYVAHPDVVAHFVPCIVAMPLAITNLGYLAGMKLHQYRDTLCFSIAGSGSIVAAGAIMDIHSSFLFLGLGATCLGMVISDLKSRFIQHAYAKTGHNNGQRVHWVADWIIPGLIGYPITVGLGLAGQISEELELVALVGCDTVSQILASHLYFKDRAALLAAEAKSAAAPVTAR